MNDQVQPITKSELKWGVKQRLAYLEVCAFWGSRLTTNMLMDTFGIGRRQAGKDIALYQNLAPDNLDYDKVKRGYVCSNTFKPEFIDGTGEEYLEWLKSISPDSTSYLSLPPYPVSVEPLKGPVPKINTQIIKAVIQGIQEKKQVFVTDSVGSPELPISPHTLINTAEQWLVRAYNNHFPSFITIDLMTLNYARISDIPSSVIDPSIAKRVNCEAADKAWQQQISLTVTINPDIGEMEQEERCHIENVYQMTNGVFTAEIRKPLVEYYVNRTNSIIHESLQPLFIVTE